MILTVLLILCICAGISSVFGGSPSKKAQLAARGGGNQSLLDSNGNSNKSVHGPLTQSSNNHHNNQTASSSSSVTVALSINAENQLILAFKVLASRDFFPKQMFPKFMRAHREHTTTTAAGHALKEVYVDSSDGEDQSLSLLRVVRGALVRYLDDYHPGDFTPSPLPCSIHCPSSYQYPIHHTIEYHTVISAITFLYTYPFLDHPSIFVPITIIIIRNSWRSCSYLSRSTRCNRPRCRSIRQRILVLFPNYRSIVDVRSRR